MSGAGAIRIGISGWNYGGWRGTFYLLAAVTMLSTIAVYVFVVDAPEGHPFHRRRIESVRQSLTGLIQVIQLPQLPYVLMLTTIGFSILKSLRMLHLKFNN